MALPYLFTSYEHVEAYFESDAYAQLCEEFKEATNIQELGTFHAGFRNILSNVEIHSADDMQGLMIRVPEVPSFVTTFGALGCNTTTLAATDVYQALQTGMVEATEAALSYMRSMNYQDVTKYCIMTNHIYNCNSIYINADKLASMDEAAATIIQECAKEASKAVWESVYEQDEESIAAFEEAGLEIIEPDLDSFRALMVDVWAELYTDVVDGGQEALDAALACDPT